MKKSEKYPNGYKDTDDWEISKDDGDICCSKSKKTCQDNKGNSVGMKTAPAPGGGRVGAQYRCWKKDGTELSTRNDTWPLDMKGWKEKNKTAPDNWDFDWMCNDREANCKADKQCIGRPLDWKPEKKAAENAPVKEDTAAVNPDQKNLIPFWCKREYANYTQDVGYFTTPNDPKLNNGEYRRRICAERLTKDCANNVCIGKRNALDI